MTGEATANQEAAQATPAGGAENEEARLIDRLVSPNNPRAGAEFLSREPKRGTLPALFFVVTSGRPLPEKLNALSNIKKALDKPQTSGLTGNPQALLDSVILETKEVWINPSPQALITLERIRGNFERGLRGSRTQTLTGENYEVLTLGVDSRTLIQAVMAGVFNADESPQFREVLFKTFLTWAAKPTFRKHYFGPGTSFGEVDFTRERESQQEPEGWGGRYGRAAGRVWNRRDRVAGEVLERVRRRGNRTAQANQPEAPQREQAQAERAQTGEEPDHEREQRERNELLEKDREIDDLKLRLEQLQHTAGRRTTTVLEQQATIRELQRQLDEARMRTPGGNVNITDSIPTQITQENWHRVLDVIPIATPQTIQKRYRELQGIYHPDRVLASLEQAGISRDSPVYQALRKFAHDRTAAINRAYEEAKRLGKVPRNH